MKCAHDGGNCWASVCGVGSCEMLQLTREALRAVKPARVETLRAEQERQIIERARQLSGQFLEREAVAEIRVPDGSQIWQDDTGAIWVSVLLKVV